MRKPDGYTLVEILVVAAVGTAIFGVTIGVLYLLKEAQVAAFERTLSGRTVGRLAEVFRDDVHRAAQIERPAGQAGGADEAVWRLAIPPETVVEYRFSATAVERTESTESAGSSSFRESHRLPAGTAATREPAESPGSIVTLRIEPAGRQPVLKWRPIVVDAVLGLDRRVGEPAPEEAARLRDGRPGE
jgi:hypothetical protein